MDNTFNITKISTPQYVEVEITTHAISIPEIVLIVGTFIFLTYWLIRVRRDKEKYTRWTNPAGREINLYKLINILFYTFISIVIIGGIIQIIISGG